MIDGRDIVTTVVTGILGEDRSVLNVGARTRGLVFVRSVTGRMTPVTMALTMRGRAPNVVRPQMILERFGISATIQVGCIQMDTMRVNV